MAARVALAVLACTLSVRAVLAAPHISVVPSAYEVAARTADIPPTLLWAIALQESGLVRRSRFVPWPWTLNVAGVPARFNTREQACRALHRALKRNSPRRIDVGLTQLNWGYHHNILRNPCDLLDPFRNLARASQLLFQLHQKDESWVVTAEHYHRPAGGPEAVRYGNALRVRLAQLRTSPERIEVALRRPIPIAELQP